jgi:hypothetical protein
MYINAVANSVIYGYDFNKNIFKIKQIIYSLSVSPQPQVKSSCCAPAADIGCVPTKKLSVTCFLVAELKRSEYTFGRDASCTVVINESHLSTADFSLVSRRHFKISRTTNGVYLEGFAFTYVKDHKIGPGEKIILKHNDHIAIGTRHLKGW